MTTPSSVSDGPQVPGHRILGVLGEGGMGRVYLAEDTALGRRVAIKAVSERVGASPEAHARFLREARSLAAVEHPNVVRVYSFGQAAGSSYLVMEHIAGENLADRLRRTGSLLVPEALGIAREIAEGLAAAWEQGVIHRDVKPSNVLVAAKGRVRVADFGLAKSLAGPADSELTQEGRVLGSPYYLAPEQARGQPVDFRADVYSLGVVLYEMLTGRRPFEGATPLEVVAKRLAEDVPRLREHDSDVPEGVAALVAAMTHRDPARRPASYAELLRRMDACAAAETSATLTAASPSGAPPARSRRRWWLTFAGAAAVLLAAWGLTRGLARKGAAPTGDAEPGPLVVAVTPFYGPDTDSLKEGRVMAALVAREVGRRLGGLGARVLGVEDTKEPVRDHAAARALGERLGASVVIWGETFALRGETEMQPYFTLVPPKRATEEDRPALLQARGSSEALGAPSERAAGSVTVGAGASNQIELRKTGAAGVGDLVLVLAGTHALYLEGKAQKALTYFDQAPRTAESQRYRSEALARLGKREEALAAARDAVALDPMDAQSHASLADQLLATGDFAAAVASYRRAFEGTGSVTTRRAFLDEGRLYVGETFRSAAYRKGEETPTGYLLEVDPEDGRIRARLRAAQGRSRSSITVAATALGRPKSSASRAGGSSGPCSTSGSNPAPSP
jgi:serine/threonine-protein kinase